MKELRTSKLVSWEAERLLLLGKRFAAGLWGGKTQKDPEHVDQSDHGSHLGVASEVSDKLAAGKGTARSNDPARIVTDPLTRGAHPRGKELREIEGKEAVKRSGRKRNTADFEEEELAPLRGHAEKPDTGGKTERTEDSVAKAAGEIGQKHRADEGADNGSETGNHVGTCFCIRDSTSGEFVRPRRDPLDGPP